LENYRAAMEKISKDHDLTWVIVGTANEASLGMRALSWYNTLLRFGLNVPLVVAHDVGAAGYLEKPFLLADVDATIERMLAMQAR
jgi:hypothetical protein